MAFLHGELEEKILMEQPQGYEVKGAEDKVCLLQKSIYGLKQSPSQWYKKFDNFMIGVGFLRCKFDSCLYFKKVRSDTIIFSVLYVDDILIAYKDKVEIARFKREMNVHFEMKDLGQAKRILDMSKT